MVLQLAVRDIGQLTDLALEPDEPLIGAPDRQSTLPRGRWNHGPFGKKGF
jgi:hypothetical protein